MMQTVYSEDFGGFRVGAFPYERFLCAMGEYHYTTLPGYSGRWYEPTPQMSVTMQWMISDYEPGKHCMEYAGHCRHEDETWQLLLASGESDWDNCTYAMRVRTLYKKNVCGLAFRYKTSKQYLLLALDNGNLSLKKHLPNETILLASAAIDYDVDHFYTLQAVCEGQTIRCSFEGQELFSVQDDTYLEGKLAFATLGPAQFTDVSVGMEAETYAMLCKRRAQAEIDLATERAKYPQPLLWKVLDFKNFGVGRSIRFGHLLGDGRTQMVLAQNQRRVRGDAFARISCLTAVDLEGHVLWQIGEPSDDAEFITCDLPFQVYDIDGDGYDEVIYARDFKLIIADGRTGETKKWMYTPYVPAEGGDPSPYDRLNVDFIRICNFTGGDRPTDLLIKDRYHHVWAYTKDFELLWDFEANVCTGHTPYAYDFNEDGRDELLVGYDMLSADGKLLWSADIHEDHVDEIVVGRLKPGGEKMIGTVCGWEGFVLLDFDGNIRKRYNFGHAQRISVGNFRPDLPGLQICTVTFHRNQGIIALHDCEGDPIWIWEPGSDGNILTPVNWTGNGQDLIMLNGNQKYGGMIDGFGRRVVMFPDDGHPDMCVEVMDLTGDGRDEVLLWDENRMYIYTQSDVMSGDVNVPRKYPHYNASNYRGEYAYRGDQ